MSLPSISQRSAETRQAIEQANSWDRSQRMVTTMGRALAGRAMDYAEQRFFFGLSVANAEKYSRYGDGFMAALADATDINVRILRESLDFYDSFGGSYDAMLAHSKKHVWRRKSMKAGDVSSHVRANKRRAEQMRTIRQHNAENDDNLSPEEIGVLPLAPPPTRKERRKMRAIEKLFRTGRFKLFTAGFRKSYARLMNDEETETTVMLVEEGKRAKITINMIDDE